MSLPPPATFAPLGDAPWRYSPVHAPDRCQACHVQCQPALPSTRRQIRVTVKQIFQTSVLLLFISSATLLYLQSPKADSSLDQQQQVIYNSNSKTLNSRTSVDAVDAVPLTNTGAGRSRRMIRALRSSSPESKASSQEANDISTAYEIPAAIGGALAKPQVRQNHQTNNNHNNNNNNNNKKDSKLLRKLTSSKAQPPPSSEEVKPVGTKLNNNNNNNNIPQTELKDILFTVKTTEKFHKTRVPVLLETWVSFVKEQTYFFSDADDADLTSKTNGHLVNTNCSAAHNRKALCCKMAAEFDAFLKDVSKRWFCHVDDDTYVNVPEMLHLLRTYDHREDWYLGKPSLRHPIEIIDRDHFNHEAPSDRVLKMSAGNNAAPNPPNAHAATANRATFWFATGGAGFCLSRALANKMAPVAGGGRFKIVGDNIRMTDDITMGYIVEHVLRRKLTVVERFHSHLESMRLIAPSQITSQVTLSYGSYGNEMNVLRVKGFSEREDPSRLRSLHCKLFGDSPGSGCPKGVKFS